MLPSHAKKLLADNLRLLSGGTDTQAFRERIAKRTGGAVSARTIGSMMSATSGNPTLQNIEAVAEALGVSIANLFSANLGKGARLASDVQGDGGAAGEHGVTSEGLDQGHAVSANTLAVLKRLEAAEAAGSTTPELFRALEAVLDLAQPPKTGGGYDGLDRMPAE